MNLHRMIHPLRTGALAALAMLLDGCSSGPTPLTTNLCELPIYPQRLVQLTVQIGPARDGSAMLMDAGCPAIRIELRLTGAAARSGFDDRLKKAAEGLADPSTVRLPAVLTGVYSGPTAGSFFTAEAVAEITAGKT